MKVYLIAYGATLLGFLVLDFVWLSRMSEYLYRPVMGDMVLETFRLWPALVFYLGYAAGLVFLAVHPALVAGDWKTALVCGAITGLMAYGTYDLTNHATLKNWSTLLTVTDLAWGTILSAAASVGGYLAASAFASGN
ncbi:MAG: DUF2177 family protein [Hyphomicrobiaceae bacterium]